MLVLLAFLIVWFERYATLYVLLLLLVGWLVCMYVYAFSLQKQQHACVLSLAILIHTANWLLPSDQALFHRFDSFV